MASHSNNQDQQQQQPQGRPILSLQTSVSQHQGGFQPSPTSPNMSGPQSVGPGGSTKKRKGTRSVSTLTPAQLERKRANDREAQRAIRARTKDTIETLNREKSANQQTIGEINRENYALKAQMHQLRQEVKHLRERHSDNEPFMAYEPLPSAPTPTPGRVGSTASSLFLSQPVTPSDTRPPPNYSIMTPGGSHFGTPEDTSPGQSYMTSIGDHGEWPTALLHNPLQQCSLPSPTSAGGNSASSVDGPSFMPNSHAGHAMDSTGSILRTPQPDEYDLEGMARANVGYAPPTSLSPSPGVGDHSHLHGGPSPLGSLTPGQMQHADSPYLHQPHPQHFNSAVTFGQGGPFPQPTGTHHLYSSNYYSPVSRSPVPM
ncbi:hypothetical protein MKZ38_005243 [Zalerion maritima]|uniref:BZIP transcription factor n=1 Tax=Zalerion maritima TaxID=339359 RepID=A0AAD5RLH9_9PEZI|nr:hypothetical protein MKZ38_005243 [Zalerion maritima]